MRRGSGASTIYWLGKEKHGAWPSRLKAEFIPEAGTFAVRDTKRISPNIAKLQLRDFQSTDFRLRKS